MQKQINIQDVFLNVARKEHQLVTVFLMNGFQFKGYVNSFDSFAIILETEGKNRLVYKHAVSTIVPEKNFEINDN